MGSIGGETVLRLLTRCHRTNMAKSVLMAALFLCSGNAFAQSVDKEEKESKAIIELLII